MARLEEDVARPKGEGTPSLFGPMPAARQAELSRLFREVLKKMGIDADSRPVVRPEEIRRRMIAHGVRTEDRLASRGIRGLRGECEG
ncbi:MAG: hypothetical protein HY321_11205 [Armatimonadetes bacterium]|nr:hypothetical protein [Armatimonadota bacterium]